MNLATEILRVSRELARDSRPIRSVRVAIGELSAVEPDQLRFAWDAVVSGGDDDGAALEIDWCPARQTCPACGVVAERAAGSWLRLCPRCGSPLRVEGGDDLDVTEVTSGLTGAFA